MTTADLTRSPLDAVHRRLGAKMGPFAGWDMPIEYAGTLSEHRAVREAVGVFDLTHLGKVEVSGQGAFATLQHALTNDLAKLTAPGFAQYTLCCDDTGGIVDDLIVYREGDPAGEPAAGPGEPAGLRYLLVPNAANWPRVLDLVRASAREGTGIVPRPDLAVVAVQGPNAPALVERVFPEAAELDYMHHTPVTYQGRPARLARTGYTGERGFEIVLDGDQAEALWDQLFELGADLGVTPAGLGARDTLRLEMGYPLHGNDISTQTSPIDARLRWAVALGKGDFRGRDAIAASAEAGPVRVLTGLDALDRPIPRHGMRVLDGDREVGEVTSGTFSPTLRRGVAMAYLDPAVADPGTELTVDVRGKRGRFKVTRPPFVDASPK